MDRAATFTAITERNALRRAAQLPLLDVRAEMDAAAHLAAIAAFWAAASQHADREVAIRATVLAEYRARHSPDFPRSPSGHRALAMETRKRFHAYLARLNIVLPAPRRVIPYGPAA